MILTDNGHWIYVVINRSGVIMNYCFFYFLGTAIFNNTLSSLVAVLARPDILSILFQALCPQRHFNKNILLNSVLCTCMCAYVCFCVFVWVCLCCTYSKVWKMNQEVYISIVYPWVLDLNLLIGWFVITLWNFESVCLSNGNGFVVWNWFGWIFLPSLHTSWCCFDHMIQGA